MVAIDVSGLAVDLTTDEIQSNHLTVYTCKLLKLHYRFGPNPVHLN